MHSRPSPVTPPVGVADRDQTNFPRIGCAVSGPTTESEPVGGAIGLRDTRMTVFDLRLIYRVTHSGVSAVQVAHDSIVAAVAEKRDSNAQTEFWPNNYTPSGVIRTAACGGIAHACIRFGAILGGAVADRRRTGRVSRRLRLAGRRRHHKGDSRGHQALADEVHPIIVAATAMPRHVQTTPGNQEGPRPRYSSRAIATSGCREGVGQLCSGPAGLAASISSGKYSANFAILVQLVPRDQHKRFASDFAST